MFKQIKNFFTEDAGVNRRKAPRVDARGEANVIIKLKDDKFNIDFDADVLVMRVNDEGLACRFFLLHPSQKKQIQEYLDYYKAG